MRDLLRRLYSGENDVDFLGARRVVLVATILLVVVFVTSLAVRGLNLSIDFEGGISWEVPQGEGVDTDEVAEAVSDAGLPGARVQTTSGPSGDRFLVRAGAEDLDLQEEVSTALAELNGVDETEVSRKEVSASWGDEITAKAQQALIWFFVLIAAYLALRFEWRMALGAMIAMVHDVLMSVGVYSLFQFEVTPATVIAFLTIMGYSLYDTIVVFDRLHQNELEVGVRSRVTYAELANRSMNEVVMRSINTSITSLLPVVSIFLIGSVLLGASTLGEFAVALLVGMLVGSYSSLFIAAPIVVLLKQGNFEVSGSREGHPEEAPGGADRDVSVLAGGQPPRPRKRQR